MKVNNKNYDDFTSKLKQFPIIDSLRKYILWQRDIRISDGINSINNRFQSGPASINLDITVACNYACSHCVDSKILNTGDKFTNKEIQGTVNTLYANGLKSIILIGGGEPLLHPQFESIIRYIKQLGLQLGIVTNGSNLYKLFKVSDCLNKNDWIRLSLDAGSEESFWKIHNPKKKVSLLQICSHAKHLKELNEDISLGFSYIISWKGCKVDDIELIENIDEMPLAVELAVKNNFDYLTFKPCLIKSNATNQRETLLYCEEDEKIQNIRLKIQKKLEESKNLSNGNLKINESINLRALLGDNLSHFKIQTRNCHSQVFRQIVTPIGIFHCPAYRGDSKSVIASKDGYLSLESYQNTISKNLDLLLNFNATEECKDIVCFYNRLNWWVEDFINSDEDVNSIESVPDENFFL